MPNFKTKREIAERFRVSPRTVENWIERGLLNEPVKLGEKQQSRVRWTDDDVVQLEQRLRGSASVAA